MTRDEIVQALLELGCEHALVGFGPRAAAADRLAGFLFGLAPVRFAPPSCTVEDFERGVDAIARQVERLVAPQDPARDVEHLARVALSESAFIELTALTRRCGDCGRDTLRVPVGAVGWSSCPCGGDRYPADVVRRCADCGRETGRVWLGTTWSPCPPPCNSHRFAADNIEALNAEAARCDVRADTLAASLRTQGVLAGDECRACGKAGRLSGTELWPGTVRKSFECEPCGTRWTFLQPAGAE